MENTISVFSQLLRLFSRADFQRAVKKHQAEKGAKGFDSWAQFIAMLFAQLGRAHSLREICQGLASIEGKLNHLGVKNAPARSTLAYANAHRSYKVFEEVFFQLLDRCQSIAPGKKFRFKNKLYSLDATTIDLCLSIFDWAKFRRAKGAIKLHLLLDHDGCLPCFANMTEGAVHEINVARSLDLSAGAIVAMDRGYVDFAFFDALEKKGVFFVTRLKENAVFEIQEAFSSPKENILSDELIKLPGSGSSFNPDRILRRVVLWREDKQSKLVLLTNNRKLSSKTIAAIYKERWQIELFFKAIKQNLKIKTFLGTSPNAVRVQIWTALISILLLKYLKMRSTIAWSLSNLIALLRLNLFVHRDLWLCLNEPFKPPPATQLYSQSTLAL